MLNCRSKDFMQILINGMISGLSLALLSVAFSAVYLPTRVFYIALAGVYTIVPFIVWACIQHALPYYIAILIAVLAGTIISASCEIFNHKLLEAKRASSGAHMITSLGIYIVVSQVAAMLWGNESKVLRSGLDQTITFADIVITNSQLATFVVSVCLLTIFYAWLCFSNVGLRFRALADNPREFALTGYSVNALRALSFGISGLFCSVSSLLVANDIGFDAHGGLSAVLLAVVAVIVGGKYSFAGATLGAILLGLIRANVVWLLSARWQEAITFLALALFLILRPHGLLQQKSRVEAEAV